MTYIYDTVIDINAVSLERYGVTFKLEQTFKMGSRKFASFTAPGMDKLLIVPQFAEQYQKICSRLIHLKKDKTFDDYVKYIQQRITEEVTVDSEPDLNDESVIVYNCTFQYKDIKVKLLYSNGKMWMSPEFEVVQNNLFGNGFVVNTKPEDEDF